MPIDRDDSRETYLKLRRRAMDYLARREHSKLQLQRKLLEKFPDCGLTEVEAIIQQLEAENLQSDSRFAESYCYSKSARGYGPVYIRHHLLQAGVSSSMVEQQLESYDDDFWVEKLSELLVRKRIRVWPAAGSVEWQRTNRLVRSRGFSAQHTRAVSVLLSGA
jgi:regulatory protein